MRRFLWIPMVAVWIFMANCTHQAVQADSIISKSEQMRESRRLSFLNHEADRLIEDRCYDDAEKIAHHIMSHYEGHSLEAHEILLKIGEKMHESARQNVQKLAGRLRSHWPFTGAQLR